MYRHRSKEHTVLVETQEGNEERSYVGAIMNDMDFNVRARAGSMLPENKEFVENKIMQLMQMGVITDPLYILNNIELPGKEKLINQIQSKSKELGEKLKTFTEQEEVLY